MASAVVTEAVHGTDERETAPWWTPADDAELSALTRELVDGIFGHRPRCSSCAAGYPPCPHVVRAIEVVVAWREARDLRSYARWLRHQRDLIELAEDTIVHRLRGRG